MFATVSVPLSESGELQIASMGGFRALMHSLSHSSPSSGSGKSLKEVAASARRNGQVVVLFAEQVRNGSSAQPLAHCFAHTASLILLCPQCKIVSLILSPLISFFLWLITLSLCRYEPMGFQSSSLLNIWDLLSLLWMATYTQWHSCMDKSGIHCHLPLGGQLCTCLRYERT